MDTSQEKLKKKTDAAWRNERKEKQRERMKEIRKTRKDGKKWEEM